MSSGRRTEQVPGHPGTVIDLARRRSAPEANGSTASWDASLCRVCELGELRSIRTQVAVWRRGQLFVVQDIPAQHCPTCGEEFIDAATAHALHRLKRKGPKGLTPTGFLRVPMVVLPDI